MENKELITSFLTNSIFFNLSNVFFNIIDFKKDKFLISVILKNECFYKYEEIKSVLNESYVYEYDDEIYSISLKVNNNKSKNNIFEIEYEIGKES